MIFRALTSHSYSQENRALNRCFTLCLAMLCIFTLSACGSPFSTTNNSSRSHKTRKIDTSNARKATLETNIGVNDLRNLAKPTSLQENAPLQNASARSIRTVNGSELNVEPRQLLFAERLKDSDDRFDRLETAVQDLQDDFNEISPAISRLVKIEGDIKDLLQQLETLVNNDHFVDPPSDISPERDAEISAKAQANTAKTSAAAPSIMNKPGVRTLATAGSYAPKKKEQTRQKPQTTPSKTAVKRPAKVSAGDAKMRVADHSDKTRFVFETAQKSTYQVNFDASEQLITIDTNHSFSEAEINRLARMSKRIAEVTMAPGANGGQTLIILARNVSKLSAGTHISPNKDNPNHRYFFDMLAN